MRYRLELMRGLAVIGLAASSASLADQALGDGTFCSFESGCEAVTSSAWGKPFGVPLPIFGLVGFASILGLSLVSSATTRSLVRRLSLVGALIGISLIVVQLVVLGRTCPLCLVADNAALFLGLLALAPVPAVASSLAMRGLWAGLGLLGAALPLFFALAESNEDPPDWIRDHWVEGKVNIVEVTDFECEHCRRADEYVRDALKERPDVNLVRIAVAMPKHPHSKPAAIAYRAALAQGRGKEMAEQLFVAEILTPAECRRIAERLGLNLAEYDRVASDPATAEEVEAISAKARASGPGAPMFWIQSHVAYGSPSIDNFDRPLSRARPYRKQ
jgi:uncharacterized membrane protein